MPMMPQSAHRAALCHNRRMLRRYLFAATLAEFGALASAQATEFTLDTVHTQVYACVSHLGFSTPCARFHVKSGFFHFDASHWNAAKVDVRIDTTSLDLGDAAWNSKVRSWEFLETQKYPDAHFVSRSVEKTGERSGVAHGMLTVRGITQPVDLHIEFNRAGLDPYTFRYTAGFSATVTLKRSKFGMKKYLPEVGDEVTIRVEAEGLRGTSEPDQTDSGQVEH
jgi:polyisoprenoid-binding protein YceI